MTQSKRTTARRIGTMPGPSGNVYYRVQFTHPRTGKRTSYRWDALDGAHTFVRDEVKHGLAVALDREEARRLDPLGARPSSATTPTVVEYAGTWLSRKRNISQKTRELYQGRINSLLKEHPIGGQRIGTVTENDAEEFLTWLTTERTNRRRGHGVPLSPRYLEAFRKWMLGLFDSATQTRPALVHENPFSRTEKIVDKRPAVAMFLTSDEIDGIMAQAPDPEAAAFFTLLYATGMRRSEAQDLTWRNVRVVNAAIGEVTVERGKSDAARRTISVPLAVVEMLGERGGAHEPVFRPGRTWWHFWSRMVSAAQSAVRAREAGIPPLERTPRVHDLRHTHASELIGKGVPLLLVSRRLGHSTINVTANIYGHIMTEQDSEIADMIELPGSRSPRSPRPRLRSVPTEREAGTA